MVLITAIPNSPPVQAYGDRWVRATAASPLSGVLPPADHRAQRLRLRLRPSEPVMAMVTQRQASAQRRWGGVGGLFVEGFSLSGGFAVKGFVVNATNVTVNRTWAAF